MLPAALLLSSPVVACLAVAESLAVADHSLVRSVHYLAFLSIPINTGGTFSPLFSS